MKRSGSRIILPVLALLVSFVWMAEFASAAKLQEIRTGKKSGFTRLVLQFEAPPRFHVKEQAGANRLALVFFETTSGPLRTNQNYSPPVETVAVQQSGPDLEVVVALSVPDYRLKTFKLTEPHRVVFDLYPVASEESLVLLNKLVVKASAEEGQAVTEPPPPAEVPKSASAAPEPSPAEESPPTAMGKKPAATEPAPAEEYPPTAMEEMPAATELAPAEEYPPTAVEEKPAATEPAPAKEYPPTTMEKKPGATEPEPKAIEPEQVALATGTPDKITQTTTAPVQPSGGPTENKTPPENKPFSAAFGTLQRNLIVVLGGISIVILVLIGFLLLQKRNSTEKTQAVETGQELKTTADIMASIDARIKEKFKQYEEANPE